MSLIWYIPYASQDRFESNWTNCSQLDPALELSNLSCSRINNNTQVLQRPTMNVSLSWGPAPPKDDPDASLSLANYYITILHMFAHVINSSLPVWYIIISIIVDVYAHVHFHTSITFLFPGFSVCKMFLSEIYLKKVWKYQRSNHESVNLRHDSQHNGQDSNKKINNDRQNITQYIKVVTAQIPQQMGMNCVN